MGASTHSLDHSHRARQLLRFFDQGPQADRYAVLPEGLIPCVETERREQFHDVLGGPGTQQLQVERLELCSQALALREEALCQEFTESVAVDVKRAMKVRDVGPQVLG